MKKGVSGITVRTIPKRSFRLVFCSLKEELDEKKTNDKPSTEKSQKKFGRFVNMIMPRSKLVFIRLNENEVRSRKLSLRALMKELIKNRIGALLSVKSIVTLILTAVFMVLALRGDITGQDFMTIFLMVISFYFGTQSKKGQGAAENAVQS